MPQSATPVYRFAGSAPAAAGGELRRRPPDLATAACPGWREAEAALGLCAALAAVHPRLAARPVRHALETLVRQRVFQIACGYEDQDDADTLRTDPLLKLVCGRLPETGRDLASQPTLLAAGERGRSAEPATGWRWRWASVYLRERERDGVPTHIVLDLDGTDDPTHGQQEGSAYHGYYRQHMYHPLLVFDGETDQLITAVLRPGNAHASTGVVAVLKRVVRGAAGALAGGDASRCAPDSGGAVPAIYDCCEQEGIAYTIGLVPNPAPDARSPRRWPPRRSAQRAADGAEKVRLLGETTYQAEQLGRTRGG